MDPKVSRVGLELATPMSVRKITCFLQAKRKNASLRAARRRRWKLNIATLPNQFSWQYLPSLIESPLAIVYHQAVVEGMMTILEIK